MIDEYFDQDSILSKGYIIDTQLTEVNIYSETPTEVGEYHRPILLDNGKQRCHTIISNCIVSTLYDMHDLSLDCRLHVGHNVPHAEMKTDDYGKKIQ